MQQLIAAEQNVSTDEITVNTIVDYLMAVDGTLFGGKTLAKVYESGASVKEINLVWAPVIERNESIE